MTGPKVLKSSSDVLSWNFIDLKSAQAICCNWNSIRPSTKIQKQESGMSMNRLRLWQTWRQERENALPPPMWVRRVPGAFRPRKTFLNNACVTYLQDVAWPA